MKIGNNIGPFVNAGQSKAARGRKTTDRQETNRDVLDSVDLAASAASKGISTVGSYDEAVNVAKGMDYRKAASAHSFGVEAAADVVRLL